MREKTYLNKDTSNLIELYNRKDTDSMAKGDILVELIGRSRRLLYSASFFSSRKHKEDIKRNTDLIVSGYITAKNKFDKTNCESDLIDAYAYFKHFDFLARYEHISKDFFSNKTDKDFLDKVDIVRLKYLRSAKQNYDKGDFLKALREVCLGEDLGVLYDQQTRIKKYQKDAVIQHALHLVDQKQYVEAMQILKDTKNLSYKFSDRVSTITAEYLSYLGRRHVEDALKKADIKEKIAHYYKARLQFADAAIHSSKISDKYKNYIQTCIDALEKSKKTHKQLFDEITSTISKTFCAGNPYAYYYSADAQGYYDPMNYRDQVKLLDNINYGSTNTSQGTKNTNDFDFDTSDSTYDDSDNDTEYAEDHTYEIRDLEEQIRQEQHDIFVVEERIKDEEHWQYYEEMGIE